MGEPNGRQTAVDHRYGELVRQYLDLREQHPSVILLFRVGSFYEILFEDAELAAGVLGLKLSERSSGGTSAPVPQCGFTAQALDSYLPRLLAHGYRVAVCEEETTASAGVRNRSVVRTLTPGTVTDPRLLREDQPSYLVAVVMQADQSALTGLAWTDLAAGEFRAGEFDRADAEAEIARLDPAEILLPAGGAVPEQLTRNRLVTAVGPADGAAERVRNAYPDAAMSDLPQAAAAAGIILDYLERTQAAEGRPVLEAPRHSAAGDAVRLDAATLRHLEIVETEHAHRRQGSLLAILDRTATPMGQRMLRDWLLRPLTDRRKIAARHRMVAELVADPPRREALFTHLQPLSDLERLAGRTASRHASPDDLRALSAVAALLPRLGDVTASCASSFLRGLGRPQPLLAAFAHAADAILAPDAGGQPVLASASPELARARRAVDEAAAWQTRFLADLRHATGITRLRLDRSSTQGLYLETPANTPVPPTWIRRGGLQRVERYTTLELEEHAARLAEAEATANSIATALLDSLRDEAVAVTGEARDLARRLAAADALLSLAIVAAERGWTMPQVDDSGELAIVGGRHPVAEQAEDGFQANDTFLSASAPHNQLIVLTGPNMAGKSTWMRQTALIALLAQAGSFVPAESARVGMVDAIFARIGAVDDLSSGRSTFMVEMLETAAVLRRATSQSLVILDELGRGTSTHDGMAIAWAVVEYLVRGLARPRAIAATHYHELASLRALYPQIALRQAMVEERDDGIVFTHRIEAGAADRSFGMEVARLADLPAIVVERAREVAAAIEPLSGDIARRLGTLRQ